MENIIIDLHQTLTLLLIVVLSCMSRYIYNISSCESCQRDAYIYLHILLNITKEFVEKL